MGYILCVVSLLACLLVVDIEAQEVYSCGGFIKSSTPIAYDKILVKLYTREGNLKYETDCAPNNGYYMIPVYNKGSFVIRVHPPHGWKFDPESIDITVDGENDACSQGKDINFEFMGFPITGQVVSGSKAHGPSGFKVDLVSATNQVLQSTTTVDGGSYKFEGVMPGTYKILGGAQSICAARTEANVDVKDKAVKVEDDLVITGYALTGKVAEDGKAISGVEFWLFSRERKEVTNCDTAAPEDLKKIQPSGYVFLCRTKSAVKTGRFEFSCVPPGQYSVAAVYRSSNGVYFDMEPKLASLSITNAPAEFTQTFQVTGFSVTGRVLTSLNGSPLSGVSVSVNGKLTTKTTSDGTYQLTSVKSGQYQLEMSADRMQFESKTIKLSTTAPQIDDIVPSRYEVCGRVVFDNYPDSLPRLQQRRVLLTPKSGRAESLTTDADGTFCKMMAPGAYDIEPQLLANEKSAGVSLVPASQQVTVKDKPITNVEFRQFAAKLSGQVRCLVPCKSVSVEAINGDGHVVSTVNLPAGASQATPFELKDMLPGKYTVRVKSDGYCWEKADLSAIVERNDVSGINFRQVGFWASVSSTHAASLQWRFSGNDVVTGEEKLAAGLNRFCVPVAGKYELRVESSCHRFTPESASYDVSEPEQLQFTASHHRIAGTLLLPTKTDDLKVQVHRVSADNQAPEELSVQLKMVTKKQTNAEGQSTTVEIASDPPTYTYEHYAQSNQQIRLIPKSAVYLFEPDDRTLDVKDDCIPNVPAFHGQKGLFLNGKIEPALARVKVTMKKTNDAKMQYVAVTSDQGTYSIGPVRSFDGFELEAERTGYVFTHNDQEKGYFRAYKLSELTIKVTDLNGDALPSVLISISGGAANFRTNNHTSDDGSITFVGLSPGEYFIRPVLKEYKFEPNTKIVEVVEGSTVNVDLQGTRFAYSCLGAVRHLGGQHVSGAVLEAVSEGCNQLQEEDTTNEQGKFRVRGLNPGCEYQLRVRSDGESVSAGAYPSYYTVKVTDNDVHNFDFVLRPVISTMEVQGVISTSPELLSSLRVELYAEKDLDNRLQVVNLAAFQSVFSIQDIPLDGKNYIVRLASNLMKSEFSAFKLPEVTFKANTSVRFFEMPFNPVRKAIDVEISKASYAAIPLAVIIALIVYNHAKVLPVVLDVSNQGTEWMSSTLQRHRAQAQANADSNYSIPAEFDTDTSGNTRKRQRVRKT